MKKPATTSVPWSILLALGLSAQAFVQARISLPPASGEICGDANSSRTEACGDSHSA